MKATDLLEEQHRDVEKLFESLEGAETPAKRREVFEELASSLELFYPACEKAMGMTDLLGESLVEHGVIEFGLYEADQAQGKKDFDFKVKVLKEIVEHHVEEEEEEFFPQVEDALGDEGLEQLGQRMEQRFEAARDSDFHAPLHDNLNQVLAGAMKTRKAKPASGKRKKSA